jgi:hypothetical protein
MKTAAVFALLAGSTSAFAPMPSNKATTSLNVSPDLEGMVGTSLESGNKVVSPSHELIHNTTVALHFAHPTQSILFADKILFNFYILSSVSVRPS